MVWMDRASRCRLSSTYPGLLLYSGWQTRSNSAADSSVSSVKSRSATAAASSPPRRRRISTLSRVVRAAPGGVGQDDAARVAGKKPGVGEGDEAAEAAAEHDRPGQPERVTQPPQVIGPGPQVPELCGAVVAAAMPPLVVKEDLKVLGERRQPRLHVDVVQTGTAMNGHQSRALHRRAAAGDDGWPRYIEPEGHIAKVYPHGPFLPGDAGNRDVRQN